MRSSAKRWSLAALVAAFVAAALIAAFSSWRPWEEAPSPSVSPSVTGPVPPSLEVGSDGRPAGELGAGLSPAPTAGTPEAEPLAVTLVAKDPAGKFVPGVAIEVVDADSEPESAVVLASGTTDEFGVLSVRLGRGTYRARARHEAWHGDVSEFAIPTEGDILLRMMAGSRLRVRVEDAATRRPLPGALVREIEFGWGQPARTDSEGIADLGAVHGTWARVLAECEGYLSEGEWANGLAKGSVPTPLLVRLVAARPLEVRVTKAGTREPEVGAAIYVRHARGRAEGVTDADGRCRLTAALAEPGVSVSATTRDGREGVAEVSGDAVATMSRIEIVVSAGATRTFVVVRSTDEKPVPFAEILWPWPEGARRARADAEGRATLTGLPPVVPEDLVAVAPGWYGEPSPGEEGEQKGAAVRIVARPTLSVAGRVVDAEGRPVDGVPVSLVWTGRNDPLGLPPPTRTDAQGRYRLDEVPDDPRGHVLVLAASETLGHADADVAEPADRHVEIPDLVLPGLFTFDVPFVDEQGAPVALGFLQVRQRWRGQGETVGWRTASEGKFHPVEGVRRTGAVVEMEAPGFLRDVVRIDASTTRLVAMRPCRVRGRLRSALDRAPLAGMAVELASKDRLWTLEGNGAHPKTDDAGGLDVTGLRRGRYRLSVAGFQDAEIAITADDTNLGDVELRTIGAR